MPLILPGNVGSATAATGYDVANSVRFNTNAYMHKTPGSAGTLTTWTLSTWIKRTKLGSSQYIFTSKNDGSNQTFAYFNSDDTIIFFDTDSNSDQGKLITNRVFRDVAAWYNLTFIWNTTSGTAGDRIQLWVNGVRETSFSTQTNPDQNDASTMGDAHIIEIARGGEDENYGYFYMAETVYQNNSAASPVDVFGEFDSDSGIWKPKDVSGLTFGTNGFYLDFEASGNLGNDANGGTDLTEVNVAATDQSIDTCTNNFATLNGLDFYHNSTANTGSTLTEGSLYYQVASGNKGFARSTFGVSAGKWYFEVETNSVGKGFYGVCHEGIMVDGTALQPSAVYYYEAVPDFRSGDQIITTNAVSVSAGSILGFALDMDNHALYISKDGTYMNSGNPASGSSRTGAISELFTNGRAVLSDFGPIFANVSNTSTTGGLDAKVNFGSPFYSESGGNADGNGFGNFKTAPPSGYLAFCTKNLAETGG